METVMCSKSLMLKKKISIHCINTGLFFCSFFFVHFSFGQCDQVAGPNNPATAIDKSFGGSNFSFTNTGNVFVSDNNYASAAAAFSIFLLSGKTDYLVATNFSFNLSGIPPTATICGISVAVERNATGINILSSVEDNIVSLVKNNVVVGTNEAATTTGWTTSDVIITYGGSADLWGTTWTVADVISANFGVAISAKMAGIISLVPTANIDNIKITLYYDISSVLPVKINSFTVSESANKSAIINWSVDATDNNTSFIIERSGDGNIWQKLDTVNPGTENIISEAYQYTDAHPLSGQSYYRMDIISPGKQNYFSVVKPFYISPVQLLQIYPNPASDYITVNSTGNNPDIKISDVLGRTYHLTYNNSYPGKTNIDIQSLAAGVYFVSVNNNAYTFLKK
jgi:Secretion system C-terminal sorting domain